MDTIEFLGFDLPLQVLLWLGLAVLLAACALALVTGLHFGGQKRPPLSTRAVGHEVVNELMGTKLGGPVPPEPGRLARIVTPEGHPWVRNSEGVWESEEADYIVASWPVLAGLGVRVVTPQLVALLQPGRHARAGS